jgi:hypothetical protein
MSRLTELKKQYPELNVSIFDIIEQIDTTSTYKYAPLLCKIFGEKFKEITRNEKKWINQLKIKMENLGFDLSNTSDSKIYSMHWMMDGYPHEFYEVTREFIDRMENNKIQNKDLSTYSGVETMRAAISLSNLKDVEKDLETQVIKEYEDDKWLVVRPLTFQSSKKYGSGTRWCTTSTSEKSHFERYWRKGILIYFINKETGYKFAAFKEGLENEISFWNSEDQRIDSIQLNVDSYLYPTIKEVLSSNLTNKELCTQELIKSVEKECFLSDEKEIELEEVEEVEEHIILRN